MYLKAKCSTKEQGKEQTRLSTVGKKKSRSRINSKPLTFFSKPQALL